MPIYNYKAINHMGKRVRGELTAANDIDLEERLKNMGMDLIDHQEAKARKSSPFGKVGLNDLIVMCMHMEQLDRAGVPLLESLADIRDATDSDKLRDILTDVFESLKGGEVLSKSLSKHPKVFGEVFVGLIAAGEKTGRLATAFDHLAHHLKWTAQIRRQIRKALTYPTLLFFVVVGVITVLMIFVVPKLTDFMIAQGFAIPIHTRILIGFSKFMGEYWWLVVSSPIFLFFLITGLYRTSEPAAYTIDKIFLKLPVVGPTIHKIDLARFTHFFAIMFRSGIDILDCLQSSQKVVSNRVIRQAVQQVRRTVSEGNSLTSSLRNSNQFPNLVVRMFKVGEDSGNMDEALMNINYFYDREVDDAVEKMVGAIQPTMTLFLGGMIIWVVVSVFSPLYEMFSNMKF